MDATVAQLYQGLLQQLKARLFSDEFRERHRCAETDFTRKRCLTFTIVIIFLLNLVKRALQDELDEFFKLLGAAEMATRIVTKSAFSQARQKLKYQAFVELNQVQVTYFYDHFPFQTWQGFRLVAVDGSTSELPNTPALIAHFGAWHPAVGGLCPLARVSQLFDVLNHITLDALIAPKDVGERALAAQHFALLQAGDLVLLDRDYPAFWLFALVQARGAHFCARMPLGVWRVVDQFVASGQAEQSVTVFPSYEARAECCRRGLSLQPLTVRLLRIELDSGEIEVLATLLLDCQTYPHSVFKALYHLRWPVEENYKGKKARLEIENFSGTSVLAVYQDFHAKVFTMNLTAILAQPVQQVVQEQSRTKKYTYQINMAHAYSKMKDTVVLLLQQINPLPLLQHLWRLMIKTIEPIRPGRSVPRHKRVKPKRFPMAYKPVR